MLRAFEQAPDWTYQLRADGSRDLYSIFVVLIKDQKPRSRLELERFAGSLDNPRTCRMLRDT
jgi:hypothetical protein